MYGLGGVPEIDTTSGTGVIHDRCPRVPRHTIRGSTWRFCSGGQISAVATIGMVFNGREGIAENTGKGLFSGIEKKTKAT